MRYLLFILLFATNINAQVGAFRSLVNTHTPDPAASFLRDNLLLDATFENAGTPWSEFTLSQDNLGVGGNTWARVRNTNHPNEGTAYSQVEVREACDGCKSSGYRSEILPTGISDDINTTMWYGFSVYFDTPNSGGNWTGDGNGCFLQWHPNNGSGGSTVALTRNGSSWRLVVNPLGDGWDGNGSDGEYKIPIPGNTAITSGVWHHVVMKIFWGSNNDGYVKVWVDGVLFWNETSIDFHVDGQYLKIGMNRWGTDMTSCSGCSPGSPTTIWIIGYDNFRIGNSSATYNDVAPSAVQILPEPS